VGLAFDRFDELGRLRARDRYDNAVAGPGEVLYSGGAPLQFDGPASLMRAVAASGSCEPCLSRQWLRFTFGRMESSEDACTLQSLTDRLDPARGAADASLLSMMVAMSTTDAFFYRRARETP
jgi:hypothetical protein